MALRDRDETIRGGVDDLFEHACMRCGAPTLGPSTCRTCLEALRELRALGEEFGGPIESELHMVRRPAAR